MAPKFQLEEEMSLLEKNMLVKPLGRFKYLRICDFKYQNRGNNFSLLRRKNLGFWCSSRSKRKLHSREGREIWEMMVERELPTQQILRKVFKIYKCCM